MDLLLGLDVGTTATKALLMDVKGKVIASASYGYGLITPHENWVEQNPDDLWNGVVTTIRKVLEHVTSGDKVIALSLSTQGGTLIPVDADYRPVTNAISWMDHRAHEQAEQMRQSLEKDRLYEISGWDIYDGLPLLSIIWLKQNAIEFKLVKYFLFVNDFIIHRLTGHLCMDPSNAGITQLYNIASGQWDKDMLGIAGIESDQLSPVRNSGLSVGNLTHQASKETGLPESVLVVNGAHDQYCAALGSGVLEPGDVMLSCGTAWVILGVMDKLQMDPDKRLSISPHVIPNRWGALRSMGAVGSCMEWFLDNFWDKKDNRSELYDDLNKSVEKVSSGSKGLIFFPSSGGYGPGKRGAFIGLSISHTRSEMARAIMEGIAFDLRWTMEEVHKASIESKLLRMVGGAASSPTWTQIVMDVTQTPVIVPSVTQSASFGAAILAGFGCGVFSDLKEAYQALSGTEKRLKPDDDNVNIYDKLFNIYKDTFQQVGDSLLKLSDFGSDLNFVL
jgi:xylulokinase